MINWDALVLAPCAAAFGEPVAYYPAAGPVMQLVGVFSDRYLETKFQDGIETVDYKAVLTLRVILTPCLPVQSELFSIRGVLYVITDVEPDGMGEVKISLRSATDLEAGRPRLPIAP